MEVNTKHFPNLGTSANRLTRERQREVVWFASHLSTHTFVRNVTVKRNAE